MAGFSFNEEIIRSGWGTVFCCFLRQLRDSLATESDCSGNDGAGKLFRCIKNFCFLVAIGFFVILSLKANANRDEIKGRKGKDAIDQIRHSVTKHYDWFALVNKYLWGKISQTSLKLTEIWPISDHFLNNNTTASLCITVQCAFPKIVSDKLSKLDSKLSDIWNFFSDYVRWPTPN